MLKIKKIHTIIVLFFLIFIVGIYSFTLYIDRSIDKKVEPSEHTTINNSKQSKRVVTQIK